MRETFDLLRAWMVFRDPPDHDRLRAPLRRLFTPRAVERLAPRVRAIVEELLDGMAASGGCDLVRAFAFPLPAIVIAELLGVPPGDRDEFKTWSFKLAGLVFGAVEQPDRYRLAREATREFSEYFGALIRRYESEPGENLISTLIDARDRGDSLSADQRVYLSLAGANRDPAVFSEPDRFDVGRRRNPHLAFGHGLHFCIGAHLARLEVRIAIDSLLRRFSRIDLATDRVVWGGTILGRGIPELALRFS